MEFVFVYGTLKKGHGNNRLLFNSTFLGEVVANLNFGLLDWGGFPAAVQTEETNQIHGELYIVDDTTMENLDFLEGYPNFYDRVKLEIENPVTKEMCSAWIYFIPNKNAYLGDPLFSFWPPEDENHYIGKCA